jgi:hypothetical protein
MELGDNFYDGNYTITGSLTISQGAGICDDYSGTYTCNAGFPFGCEADETGTGGADDLSLSLGPASGTIGGCGDEEGIFFSGSFGVAPANGNTASCNGTDCVNDLTDADDCGDTDTETFTLMPASP